jgi:hypothetical protein
VIVFSNLKVFEIRLGLLTSARIINPLIAIYSMYVCSGVSNLNKHEKYSKDKEVQESFCT